jgi:GNAT superfamily N-acetyltransferase
VMLSGWWIKLWIRLGVPDAPMEPLKIRRVGVDELGLYAEVPESFMCESVFRVEPIDGGLRGFAFNEENVEPHIKWDEQDEKDGSKGWPRKYKLEDWGIFIAFRGSTPVGGIAIGADAPGGLRSPFEPGDTAVVWDIRVRPEERRHGVASALFWRGVEWARGEGHRRLKLEVTSANVPMCRFCVKTGCELAAVHRLGYETTKSPDEAMLIWYYELRPTEADPT